MAVEWLDWYAVAKYAFLFCIFIVAWGVMTHTRLRYIITAVGLVQAFIVFGQFSGLIQSRHILFDVTGFMGNPGQMGGFQAVADNAVYPFNEYIKLAVETGIPGLLLFVAALCLLWHYTKDRDSFASLTTLLVFGFFSYPSDKLLPASLMPLITGTVLHDRFGALSGNAGVRFSAMAATAVMAMAIYVFSGMGHPEKHYAGIPDCETWCDLGQASEAAGEPGQAEEYYRTASYMIPTRLRPNYLLWKLYLDAGRNDDATRTAWKILSMPLKVENTYTLRVKDEVREWLAGRTGD